jgi:hypothetical protein
VSNHCVTRKGAPHIQLAAMAFVLRNDTWRLITSHFAILSANHTGHAKVWLITENDVVQATTVVASLSEHRHSKFFPTLPFVLFQCLNYLEFVCIQFHTVANCLHGCPGNLKLSASTTNGFPRAELKCLTNCRLCQRLRMAYLRPSYARQCFFP